MYQNREALLVMRIVTNFTGFLVVSPVTLWLQKLLRISSSRSDLRGQRYRQQSLTSVRSYWLVGLAARQLLTK